MTKRKKGKHFLFCKKPSQQFLEKSSSLSNFGKALSSRTKKSNHHLKKKRIQKKKGFGDKIHKNLWHTKGYFLIYFKKIKFPFFLLNVVQVVYTVRYLL